MHGSGNLSGFVVNQELVRVARWILCLWPKFRDEIEFKSSEENATKPLMVKKVVRRAELLKGHRHGFRFQACS
jgi:hypothetical protein